MVHDNSVGLSRGSGLQQSKTGCHAGYQAADFATALHLQAVWAIVTKTVNIERLL